MTYTMAHPGGRPLDITPEIIARVRELLPICLYIETVADYIGVSRFAVRIWIKRGAKEVKRVTRLQKKGKPFEWLESESIYVEFFNTIKAAIADGEIADLQRIKDMSATQWQAAAWRLERRHGERWGNVKMLSEISSLKRELEDLKREMGERQAINRHTNRIAAPVAASNGHSNGHNGNGHNGNGSNGNGHNGSNGHE